MPHFLAGLVLIVGLSFSTIAAHADTLDRLKDSKTMADFEASKRRLSRTAKQGGGGSKKLKGIDPNSSLATIWGSANGALELLNWVGAKLPLFTFFNESCSRTSEVVEAAITLVSSDNVEIKVYILIPHPTFEPLAEANMLTKLRALRPPALNITGKEPVALSSGEATLYKIKNGGCSIVIATALSGLVNVITPNCQDSKLLISVAESLDIDRLNRKLTS